MSTGRSIARFSNCPKVSPSDFSALIVTALRRSAPDLIVSARVPLSLDVRTAGSAHWTEDLSHVYNLSCAEPSLLDDLVRLRVASVVDMATLAVAPPPTKLLLPVLRRCDDIAGSDVLSVDHGGGLVLSWVVDRSGVLQSVTHEMLDGLGLSAADLADIAHANLEHRVTELTIDLVAQGVTIVASATLPASSLLLVPSFWSADHFQGRSCLTAIAPGRDTLLVFDGADAKARHIAIGLAQSMFERTEHPLSVDVIALDVTGRDVIAFDVVAA